MSPVRSKLPRRRRIAIPQPPAIRTAARTGDTDPCSSPTRLETASDSRHLRTFATGQERDVTPASISVRREWVRGHVLLAPSRSCRCCTRALGHTRTQHAGYRHHACSTMSVLRILQRKCARLWTRRNAGRAGCCRARSVTHRLRDADDKALAAFEAIRRRAPH